MRYFKTKTATPADLEQVALLIDDGTYAPRLLDDGDPYRVGLLVSVRGWGDGAEAGDIVDHQQVYIMRESTAAEIRIHAAHIILSTFGRDALGLPFQPIKFTAYQVIRGALKVSVWYNANNDSRGRYFELDAKSYCGDLSAIFQGALKVKNNSDAMTDYFEKDRVTIFEGDEMYPEVERAYKAKQAADAKRKGNRTTHTYTGIASEGGAK